MIINYGDKLFMTNYDNKLYNESKDIRKSYYKSYNELWRQIIHDELWRHNMTMS
jgi:hypothetical protein